MVIGAANADAVVAIFASGAVSTPPGRRKLPGGVSWRHGAGLRLRLAAAVFRGRFCARLVEKVGVLLGSSDVVGGCGGRERRRGRDARVCDRGEAGLLERV